MSTDEVDTAVSALEVQAADDHEGGADDVDVVLVVAEVGGLRARDDRALTVRGADRDRAGGGAVHRDGAPAGLRVDASVEDQHIAGLEAVGATLVLLAARGVGVGGEDLERRRARRRKGQNDARQQHGREDR